MISSQIGKLDAGVGEVCEFREKAEISFRDHTLVFKPEVEQIADDEKLISIVAHQLEELQERTFFLPVFLFASNAEMGIREEIRFPHIVADWCPSISLPRLNAGIFRFRGVSAGKTLDTPYIAKKATKIKKTKEGGPAMIKTDRNRAALQREC